jgi:hypothetical protein
MYKNYIVTKEGSIISKYTGEQLYVHTNKKGYQFVRMYIDGKAKTYLVHRIVATVHLPNKDNKPEINHKDGNKSNNNVWNLEWVTGKENVDHSVKSGLVKRGSDRPNSKLSDESVVLMRKLRNAGWNYYQLGERFEVAYQTAHKVCTRQTYTHI